MRFQDRTDAGKQLAKKLLKYRNKPDVLILALPRGGVPVAVEVALVLHAPLDLFLVRKLGAPDQPELAIGAIAMGDVRVLNQAVMDSLHITPEELEAVTIAEQRELKRRQQIYQENRPMPHIQDQTVILVDDGLATGASMLAAVLALNQHHPARIVVAVPVAASQTCDELRGYVDEVVCVMTPRPFRGVGMWYDDFFQLTDDDVRAALAETHSL